ncbi:hypothetical protein [Butyrivibrio sp. MB2005]|uniref:hypothetical protein n=1 Tax=Butyrivibrio sp. MB2005 TaxID=1280678 RepID=UPI00040A18A1|nr:hypothetical protein [Butyrivibrio sp. MB2005]
MNREEIDQFIEKMEEIGDVWEAEDVERVYGNDSLEDALDSRTSEVNLYLNTLGSAYIYARNHED